MGKVDSIYAWKEGFPPVYTHTSTYYLKQCPDYQRGKMGDARAALKTVSACVNKKTIAEIRAKYPNAVMLPVMTNNKLPLILANVTGSYVCTGVYEVETLSRKSLSGMERLLHKPVFVGSVIKGAEYVIVDDIVTQGGTVAALRKHVIANGGAVVSVTAFSCSAGSSLLRPTEEEMRRLTDRFKQNEINSVLSFYNIAADVHELTRAQLKYLLLFKELDCVVSKIEKARAALRRRMLSVSGISAEAEALSIPTK